jgi:hypothetical protein
MDASLQQFFDEARQGMARTGVARPGLARPGLAGLGKAWALRAFHNMEGKG